MEEVGRRKEQVSGRIPVNTLTFSRGRTVVLEAHLWYDSRLSSEHFTVDSALLPKF